MMAFRIVPKERASKVTLYYNKEAQANTLHNYKKLIMEYEVYLLNILSFS